jgi:hypothetical protein
MRFTTTLGDGFQALIEADLDIDGDIADLKVFSAETGQDISALIYGSCVWDEAWCKAQDATANDSHVYAARIKAAVEWNQPRWMA